MDETNTPTEVTERTVILDDQILFDLVTKKGQMIEEGRAISREMEELAKKHQEAHDKQNALITEVNLVKLDIIARLKEVGDQHLGEFEVPVTTAIKDGKIVFTIADSMKEFMKVFKSFDKWREAAPAKPKVEVKPE